MIKCLIIIGFAISAAIASIVFIYFVMQAVAVGFYRGKDIYIKNCVVKKDDQKEKKN